MGNEFRDFMKTTLTAFLENKGFHPLDVDAETGTLDFYRDVQGKREFLAVQFEKHGRPRLVLEAGECPKDGLSMQGVNIPLEQVSLGNLLLRARLQPKEGQSSRAWFRADTLRDRLFPKSSFARVFSEITALFPQIENWFVSKTSDKNLNIIDLRKSQQPNSPPGGAGSL